MEVQADYISTGLKGHLCKTVISDEDQVEYTAMDQATRREKTFLSWPHGNLKRIHVVLMVALGLFYSGTTDKVICYACGVGISYWNDYNDLIEKHKKLSPNCSSLLKAKTNLYKNGYPKNNPHQAMFCSGNDDMSQEESICERAGGDIAKPTGVPLVVTSHAAALGLLKGDLIGVDHNIVEKRAVRPDIAERPDYTIETNRLASFRGTWSADAPVKPADLALAGLFYTGPNDRVECAYCRGGLYSWVEDDSPLAEHRKHFPECGFILNHFDRIMKSYLNAGEGISSPVTDAGVDSDRPVKQSKQIAQQLGYCMEDIETSIHYLQQKGESPSASNLIEALFENNPVSSSESQRENLPDLTKEPVIHETKSSDINPTMLRSVSANPTQPDIRVLEEENSGLAERVTCKVCLCEEVRDVFLPCRHLVCCEVCSKEVSKCPLCRTNIAATIKAFLS